MLTMGHRRFDTPAQKERGSYPGISSKPPLNPIGVVAPPATHARNPVADGASDTRAISFRFHLAFSSSFPAAIPECHGIACSLRAARIA